MDQPLQKCPLITTHIIINISSCCRIIFLLWETGQIKTEHNVCTIGFRCSERNRQRVYLILARVWVCVCVCVYLVNTAEEFPVVQGHLIGQVFRTHQLKTGHGPSWGPLLVWERGLTNTHSQRVNVYTSLWLHEHNLTSHNNCITIIDCLKRFP